MTDGHDDLGVDAVTYSVATNELWLIQAKWSEKGRAVFSVADAARLIHGFRALGNFEFDRMNARLQTFADQVCRMLTTPDVRVHLVAAVMAESGVARTVRDMIDVEASELPYSIDFRVLSAADFHVAVRDHLRPGPVSIEATFTDGWFAHEHPYRSYMGIVKGSEVARWYLANGPALMAHNARRLLAADEVSVNLLTSPLKNPDHFLFFNNGLTVMCDSVVLEPLAASGQTEPVRLRLNNAVVVNGVQTTLALYRTYGSNPGSLADLRVMLRVVVAEGTPDGFAEAITAATNTQHRMEPRDFVALDELQARIREDFKVSLNKDYALRRGQSQPAPETGCTVDEAALALACAHPDPALISRALSSTDFLWKHAPDGAYTELFGHRPSAWEIWHSVQRLRSLRKAVHERAFQLNGRLAAIAEKGDLVIAHILFQRASLKDDVPAVLSVLNSSIDNRFGSIGFISAVFGSPARRTELITAAVSSIDKAQEQDIDV